MDRGRQEMVTVESVHVPEIGGLGEDQAMLGEPVEDTPDTRSGASTRQPLNLAGAQC